MKIFQKLMSLILVISMVCGFAFAATTYTDVATVNQTEAVEVMSALGVINGYPDGTFKPTEQVTRAEMAKMIATILNKGEDIGPMYAGACTFADTASHWAAGYVAYCAQEGIINGKNTTTFDPDAPVTGTEAAKMVLGMLGHDGEKAGLIGSAWASQTLSLAKKNCLIGEMYHLTAQMNQPFSREDTARLLLNGLQAPMVEYTGGTNITIGDVVLTQGATATVLTDATGVLQLMEECFPNRNGLRLNKTVDAFGRTCNEWNYENVLIGLYSVAPYVTYTTEVTLGQLYTDLGKLDYSKFTGGITYFIDGAASNASKMTNLKSGEYLTTIGSQGTTTEIYFDEINMSLSIVEIKTYAGTVAHVSPAVKDANGDISQEAYATITPVGNGKVAPGGWILLNGQLTGANTVLTDAFTPMDRNRVVYYTVGMVNGVETIQTVAPATAVVGTNNGWSTYAGKATNVIINGVTYPTNTTCAYAGGTYGQSETIYLDANNNVIHSDGVLSNDYCYLMAAAKTNTFADNFSAQIITDKGIQTIVELSNIHNNGNGLNGPGIYNYAIDAQGKYTLTSRSTEAATSVTNKIPTIGNHTADNNTTFVVGVKDMATQNTTFSTYAGISAVPSFSGQIAYVLNPITNTVATVFCIDATMTGISTTTVLSVYKTGLEGTITAGINNKYVTVAAIVDNKIDTVKVSEAQYALMNTGFNFYSGGVVDTFGVYTAFHPLSSYYVNNSFATFTPYQNGNVAFDNNPHYVEPTVPVYVWNEQMQKLVETQITSLYQPVNGNYIVVSPNMMGTAYIHAIYATVKY